MFWITERNSSKYWLAGLHPVLVVGQNLKVLSMASNSSVYFVCPSISKELSGLCTMCEDDKSLVELDSCGNQELKEYK
jgi:hypothetical protein